MNSEQKLEIARAAYKEIKEIIDKWEDSWIVSASWDEYIIVDGEGFGYEELNERYYLKNENDKSFDASKTYCEDSENLNIRARCLEGDLGAKLNKNHTT